MTSTLVMVTINPTFRAAELLYSLRQSKAVACFCYPEFRDSPMLQIVTGLLAELPGLREVVSFADFETFLHSGDTDTRLPVVTPASAAQIQYTSGTTGSPKGALIPHRGLVNDPRQSAVRAGATEGGVWLAVLPMFHVGGCVLAGMGAMSLAMTLVPLNFEAGLAASTCGLPLPGVEIKIVDSATGAICRRGEVGELLTRGYHTMLGYHEAPEATAATLEPDGWMHTRDLCTMDQRGYLSVAGRVTDMIIRGGENIYPREIEDALFEHEAVAAAVVVGLPDDYYGEIAGAFVKLKPGAEVTARQLTEFLRPRLSGYKLPAKWFRVTEYPQTLSGKVQKFKLRESWVAGAYAAAQWPTDGAAS